MKKIVLPIITLVIIFQSSFAQVTDCSKELNQYFAEPPYEKSSLSTSQLAQTGKNYVYTIALVPNKSYRIFFFASPIFKNQLFFKIIDSTNRKILWDLPAENPATNNKLGTAAIAPYYDETTGNYIHPYFDITPSSPLKVAIAIEVPDAGPSQSPTGAPEYTAKYGCITILILEKTIASNRTFNTQ